MKKIKWNRDYELLILSALRWEKRSKKERRVMDYIKKNIDSLSGWACGNIVEDMKDFLPIDKEMYPNIYKEDMADFVNKSGHVGDYDYEPTPKIACDKDVEHIVKYATCYSIGRSTYMPGVVIDFINEYKTLFSKNLKKDIVSIIEDAKSLGDYGDPERWLNIKEEFKNG